MTWKRGLATDDWVGLITGKGRLAYFERVGLMTGGGGVGWLGFTSSYRMGNQDKQRRFWP